MRHYACVLLLWLVGCNLLANPGNRARDFIEGLVAAEAPVQPDLSDGLAARVALDYLRALHRQGVSLDYRVAEAKRGSGGKTIVRLHVEPARGPYIAHAMSPSEVSRLGVELEPDAAAAWRVVRWWADD